MGPIRRVLFGIAGPRALRHIAASHDFKPADRAFLFRLADRHDLFPDVESEMEAQIAEQPEGMAALEADPIPGKPHPFITWLTHGGAAWLYSIAVIIAAMLGYPLPPLPPIPPPPTKKK